MASVKKKLESGAEIEVQSAPFSDAHKLYKAVMRELEQVRIEFGAIGKNVDKVEELLQATLTDEGMNTLKNIIARISSSDAVELALWPCMGRATWKGRKIIPDLFEEDDARADFLAVAREVLLFNLRPFLSGLSLKLAKTLEESVRASQR